MARETDILTNILKRLDKKFPGLLRCANEEFETEYPTLQGSDVAGQLFLGWLLTQHRLIDGKNVATLARESLRLTAEEETMLENAERAVSGFFEIEAITKTVTVRDLLTGKRYKVSVIDLQGVKKGMCIEVRLAKRFNEEYFFFGAMIIHKKKDLAFLEEYQRP